MWSVVGRGSYWAGCPDPRDVDALVVTDDPATDDEIRRRVLDVPAVAAAPRHLPRDVHITRPDQMHPYERAVLLTCPVIDGDDLTRLVPPVPWPVYAATCAGWAADATSAADAACWALRALLAPTHGLTPTRTKMVLPVLADGTRWAALARAAWEHRQPAPFTHPDLADALTAAATVHQGERITGPDGTTAAVIYRHAIDRVSHFDTPADESGSLAIDPEGWHKAPCDDEATGIAVRLCANLAADQWPHRLDGYEPLERHTYPTGSRFPIHVDRHAGQVPLAPDVADAISTRHLNVVTMVQPADRGGQLRIRAGYQWHAPRLDPGDLIVFDARLPHEVTRVDAGARVTLVTHAHA